MIIILLWRVVDDDDDDDDDDEEEEEDSGLLCSCADIALFNSRVYCFCFQGSGSVTTQHNSSFITFIMPLSDAVFLFS